MTRLRVPVFAPAALPYAGPILAGALGAPVAVIWVFAALFLAHHALTGHPVIRTFRPDRPIDRRIAELEPEDAR